MLSFLETHSGRVAARYIVRIGAVETHGPQQWHPIDYNHGGEPRSTRATEDAVAEFLAPEGGDA